MENMKIVSETLRIKVYDKTTADIIRSRQRSIINKSFHSKSLVKIINQSLGILNNYTYICIS
jgi:hypothetical protein